MDELIEKLIKEYAFLRKEDMIMMTLDEFNQAIQKAMLVQRNACKRVYDVEYAKSPDYFGDYVLKAEITEQDYE